MDNSQTEKKRAWLSLIFPLSFVILLWIIKGIEIYTGSNFAEYGLVPLSARGLIGIFTGPLIHANVEHLLYNSLPLLLLGWAIFYFYKEVAIKVFLLSYFMSQLWLWFFARNGCHIGASGLIYAYASFLFVSGIIRKNRGLMAISLLVIFAYGGMIWGIFPIEALISWEGHLMGLIAGIIIAIYYKNYGPLIPVTQLEDEDDDDELPYYLYDEEDSQPDKEQEESTKI
jgi:membrane associated rhomboid family serine protease